MKNNPHRRSGRSAFTMVELVVVVAIIGLLIALLLPAILKGWGKGAQTQARTEIGQLETALAAAKQGLAPDNPALVLPSYIPLHENISDYQTVDQAYYTYLVKIFGRRAMAWGNHINWSGDPSFNSRPQTKVFNLTGPSALVFWAGGIPGLLSTGTPTCLGFSTNVSDPWGGGTGIRKGPFFEFQPNRLVPDPNNPGFLMYLDAYQTAGTGPYGTGQVYAYFTTYQGNDYQAGDCGGTPTPYGVNGASAPFIYPNGVQILCAGKDGTFGASSSWSSSSGYPAGNAGFDDQANFSSSILGNGMTSN